jgi:hypothetical protein
LSVLGAILAGDMEGGEQHEQAVEVRPLEGWQDPVVQLLEQGGEEQGRLDARQGLSERLMPRPVRWVRGIPLSGASRAEDSLICRRARAAKRALTAAGKAAWLSTHGHAK